MKYLTTIYNIENINALSKFASGFVVGNNLFSARLTKSFSKDQINEIGKVVNHLNKELYINLNQMMSDELINQLPSFINQLDLNNITGFIVADIGVVEVLKSLNIANIIYHPETLLTNNFDFNFLSNFNVSGAFVAKEITLEDIIDIGKNKVYKMFYNGHGYLNMFYSKRKLLNHYQTFLEESHTLEDRQDLKLIEERRPSNPYPVLQDDAGTHVFRSKIFSCYKEVEKLEKYIDYFYIDTIFESDEYALDILKMYFSKDFSLVEVYEEKYNQLWDDGFLYKKTLYQVRK